MFKYIVKRLLYVVFVFFIVSIIMFGVYKMIPGDPARMMLDSSISSVDPERYEACLLYTSGTLVPITGFANAVVSPALEFKSEGLILGLGAKLFIIAGPVIVYGVAASILYGCLLYTSHFRNGKCDFVRGNLVRKLSNMEFCAKTSRKEY